MHQEVHTGFQMWPRSTRGALLRKSAIRARKADVGMYRLSLPPHLTILSRIKGPLKQTSPVTRKFVSSSEFCAGGGANAL